MTDTGLLPLPPTRDAAKDGALGYPRQLPTAANLFDVIVDRAVIYGDRPYIRHARSTRLVSFAALSRSVTWWRHWLEDQNIARDGRVAIVIADPLDFAVVFLAAIASGRWATPLDPKAPPRSTLAAVVGLRPTVVISDRAAVPAAPVRWVELATIYDGPREIAPGAADGDLLGPGSGGGVVLSSSGSTGKPKIISLHQHQLLHTARAVTDHHRLTTADVGFNPLPLFHVNAEVVGLLSSLWAGAELVLDERFHRTGFWDLMSDQGVTWINAVPAIINRLAPPGPGEVVPAAIRFIRSASAPLPLSVLKRFEQTTGVIVVETYGMTEAASQITANPVAGPRKPGSVGRPVDIAVRVVFDSHSAGTDGGRGHADVSGAAERPSPAGAPVGESGHVEIRGPSVTLPPGALGPGGSTGAPAPAGGWLRTGDIGYLDADGYLFLQGREDEVINRGGEKVYPAEIEDVLLEDPRVTDAVVVGVDDEAFGQVPVAYLTVQGVVDGEDANRARSVGADAQDRLIGSLPRSKRPVTLHIVPALATTATGKVRRHRPGSATSGAICSVAV
jgi:acyl-CoA synthetase (AMP-forming)/AMP-acid ligase II